MLEMVREMRGNAEDRPDFGKLGPGQCGDFSSVRVCSANGNIWDHYPPIFHALLRDSCFKATICTQWTFAHFAVAAAGCGREKKWF